MKMDKEALVGPIELTEPEKILVLRIDFEDEHRSDESRKADAKARVELMRSLLQREGIPECRRKYFTDPEYNIGGHGRSRRQVFEGNGTRGDRIFTHGNFTKYLRYFLFGADLPDDVVAAFRQKLTEYGRPFTSGDAYDLSIYARKLARSRIVGRPINAEEFYKLALDCGLEADDARSVRDSIMQIR